MRVFKGPSIWYQPGYNENRFHSDFILDEGEEMLIKVRSGDGEVTLLRVKCPRNKIVKIHLETSWSEDRDVVTPYSGSART